jgi:arylsulfatase A-like enzyme
METNRQTILYASALVLLALITFSTLLLFRIISYDEPKKNDITDFSKVLHEQEFYCEGCNIIIISLTNVRADHMGLYGYSRNTTPKIDQFAKKSIVFENAFSSASWTLPAFISILTSLHPLEHKVMIRYGGTSFNVSSLKGGVAFAPSLNPNITSLADILRDYNYTTATFNGGFDFDQKYGATSRFDVNLGRPFNRSTIQVPYKQLSWSIAFYGSFNQTMEDSREWIHQNKDKKFFAYVQGFDAHCPFAIPEKNEMFTEDRTSRLIFDTGHSTK